MIRTAAFAALAALALMAGAGMAQAQATQAQPGQALFRAEPASAPVRALADWVTGSGDNLGAAFVIIDKVEAKAFVFDAGGRLTGASPVLLGLARGDASVPGIGDRPLSRITPAERTTPAGRFVAARGRNAADHDILWVDYAAAISLHPVVTSNPKEQRLRRLATPSAADNRISYGCINVPATFYSGVVAPAFEGASGVVYILPEVRPLTEVFPGLAATPAQ